MLSYSYVPISVLELWIACLGGVHFNQNFLQSSIVQSDTQGPSNAISSTIENLWLPLWKVVGLEYVIGHCCKQTTKLQLESCFCSPFSLHSFAFLKDMFDVSSQEG